MKPPDGPWLALLEKAGQDEYVVGKLVDLPDSPDEVIGFHLQQAAEKLLKASLMFLGVRYRLTHNLGELIHLLEKNGHPLPEDLEKLRDLTPYATDWRYDFIPDEGGEAIDRRDLRAAVTRLRSWVEGLLGSETRKQ